MSFEPGDKVKYHTGDEKWQNGKIHGVRKAETESGEQIISYLVDTGRENPDHKGRPDRQPEQIDVRPDNIKKA